MILDRYFDKDTQIIVLVSTMATGLVSGVFLNYQIFSGKALLELVPLVLITLVGLYALLYLLLIDS